MRAYGARFEQMPPGGREKGTLEREDEEMKWTRWRNEMRKWMDAMFWIKNNNRRLIHGPARSELRGRASRAGGCSRPCTRTRIRPVVPKSLPLFSNSNYWLKFVLPMLLPKPNRARLQAAAGGEGLMVIPQPITYSYSLVCRALAPTWWLFSFPRSSMRRWHTRGRGAGVPGQVGAPRPLQERAEAMAHGSILVFHRVLAASGHVMCGGGAARPPGICIRSS